VQLTPFNNSLSISLCSSLVSGTLLSQIKQVVRRYRIGQKGGNEAEERPRFHDVYQALGRLPGFPGRASENASLRPRRPLKTSSWRRFVAFDTIRTWRRFVVAVLILGF
jgi:hypothetical protein